MGSRLHWLDFTSFPIPNVRSLSSFLFMGMFDWEEGLISLAQSRRDNAPTVQFGPFALFWRPQMSGPTLVFLLSFYDHNISNIYL